MSTLAQTARDHAVVIGGSMSGLAVAAALRNGFDHVTVIERDDLPRGISSRPGVPQDRHLHVLLSAGSDALEQLLPGLRAAMTANGAPEADLGLQAVAVVNGYRLARGPMGCKDVLASRPFTEGHVRRRLLDDPRVEILTGQEVRVLRTTPGGRRVIGVELMPRGSAGRGTPQAVDADLVVDCSGRRSAMPRWLTQLGYLAPRTDQLRVELRYATRHYAVSNDVLDDDLFVLIAATPDIPRGGGVARTDSDAWVMTLFGMAGDRPPLDGPGFESFAGTLAADDLAHVIRHSHPLDEPTGFRYPANTRQRYDRLHDFPEGLLVAGDALCSFNPIYGQGMSVAALEALALRETLTRSDGLPSPRAWFRRAAAIIDAPWELALGGDLSVRAVAGRRSLQTRMINRYMDRFYRAAVVDPVLSTLFGRVSGLLEPASRVLAPPVLARVARGNLRQRRLTDAPAAPAPDTARITVRS